MKETIRDTFRRRMQKTMLAVGAAVCGIGAALAHHPMWMLIVSLPGMLIGFAVVIAVLRRTRCPLCNTCLGPAMRQAAKEMPSVNKCPHCGVSFDSEMPEAR